MLPMLVQLLLLGSLMLSMPRMPLGALENILLLLTTGLIWLITTAVMGVNWHRFALLNQPQGFVPHLPAGPLAAYIVTALKIGLLAFAAAAPLGYILVAIASLTNAISGAMAVAALIGIAIALLMLRLSVALPGAAVQVEKPLTTAWTATRGITGTLLALAFFLFVLQFLGEQTLRLIGYLLLNISPDSIPLLVIVAAVGAWIFTLLSLSICTTLYGHYVEGRDLR
ncbi:MAG: hypothetical protein Q4G22_03595 [Paracoccus sp. (in: a-proteobacteria)]|uniref:hypothetical protein n=1 Tax=Paracoccus sp. TaxID=267 RepID=UPI0026DEAC3E|nr:hypothetical protein [Paracoccus sp. (in: a-proteobacteria)]MDO5630902.1 hypothetical protein [Paracoccus sp. (in: a-proteobacteria)]